MSQSSIDRDPHQFEKVMAAWGRAYGQGRLLSQELTSVALPAAFNRGKADVQAAWQRWHDPSVDDRFSLTEWPWYALLERARVESLASQHLPGIAYNLRQLEALSPPDPTMAQLYQAARQVFSGQVHSEITVLSRREASTTKTSAPSLRSRLRCPWSPISVEPEDLPSELSDADIATALCLAQSLLANGPDFAKALHPLITALAALNGRAIPENSKQNSAPPDGDPRPEHTSDSEQDDPDATTERPGGPTQNQMNPIPFPGYTIFSTAWDEEYPAIHWYHPNDGAALRTLNTLDRRRVRQLAHRLQRQLLSARLRHWSFDQEEGRLDSRRLARLIGHNPNPNIFRVENEAPVPEACVTLLVDQSGSMRGTRQRMAALAIDLAVHTLELCQVHCEVLGYTTCFKANNPVSQYWHRMGCPSAPGRLNALRHIVYKTAQQRWHRARPQLGLMLREGFGQENIDGEALYWAACRLMRQPQVRKVLVVLSDGAPYDEATVCANGREFLGSHLRTVIAEIEASPMQLIALGTGQSVGRYYRQAATVRRPEAVAEVLFERLGDLLTQTNHNDNGNIL